MPPDKATHGLQRRWMGGVEASVERWSQLTKLSMLRLRASLGFLCLSLPLLSGMHCAVTLTLSSHCPSHTLTCHLSGVPALPGVNSLEPSSTRQTQRGQQKGRESPANTRHASGPHRPSAKPGVGGLWKEGPGAAKKARSLPT